MATLDVSFRRHPPFLEGMTVLLVILVFLSRELCHPQLCRNGCPPMRTGSADVLVSLGKLVRVAGLRRCRVVILVVLLTEVRARALRSLVNGASSPRIFGRVGVLILLPPQADGPPFIRRRYG